MSSERTLPLPAATGFSGFGLMWAGQLISLIGSGLTRFALGVWVFQRTGSVTQFSLIALCSSLPGIFLSPFAGALVDRWDRRWVLIGCNVGAGLGTPLAIGLLYKAGVLAVWQIYLVVAVSSIFTSFQWPAYIAATTLLVSKKNLGRVSGMMQLGQAASEVVAPLLAGLLIVAVGLSGIVFIDFATFLFAAVTLLLVAILPPPRTAAGAAAKGSLWKEAAYGWTFIRARPGLFGLLMYFAMINLVFSVSSVLITPLVLSFASAAVLGTVLAASSAGLLAGSVAMTVTGGPRRRIHGVLAFGLVFGVALVFVGVKADAHWIAAALFVVMFGAPIINGSSQAIWQAKVPADVQGRVFAVRRMFAQFTAPIGFVCAGPLADKVFNPLLVPGGALAGSVGRVVGVGKGRGIGLIYLTVAVLPILASIWGYARPRLRRVEEELPDAIPG